MENWFALSVRTQREKRSNDRLVERGFETYLPWERRKTAYRQFPLPLFPGYLFARLEIPTLSVTDRGWDIYGVVSPVPVPDEAIYELRSRERDGWIVCPDRFKKGTRVQVLDDGAFFEQIGLYEGQTADERAIVLMTMFGREHRLLFPINVLTAAAGRIDA